MHVLTLVVGPSTMYIASVTVVSRVVNKLPGSDLKVIQEAFPSIDRA